MAGDNYPPLTAGQEMTIAAYMNGLPDGTPEFYRGMLKGFKAAITAMYPNVDTWFNEDPEATKISLIALAIERKAHDVKAIEGNTAEAGTSS